MLPDSFAFEQQKQLVLSWMFRVSMWWRIVYGTLRIILGTTLLHLVGKPFSEIFYRLMLHETAEDPQDALFRFIHDTLEQHELTVTYFLASYLIFWGVIDIFLSVSLLRHKLWAFPVSLILIGFFVLYSISRFFHTHSLILLGVICVDVVIMFIIYREYRVLRKTHDVEDVLISGN